jgi:hypothetical protein
MTADSSAGCAWEMIAVNGPLVLIAVLISLVWCCGALILIPVLIAFIRWNMSRYKEHCRRQLERWANEQALRLLEHRPMGWAFPPLGHLGHFEVTVRDGEGQTRRGLVRIRKDPFSFWPRYRVELRQWLPEPEPPSPAEPPRPDARDDPLWDRWLDN